jgi:hypothetical protein
VRTERRFCSTGINARQSDGNGQTAINGPSHDPGGGTTFPAQDHDEAWRTERAVPERADVLFSVSGRFRVVNSNIS